MKKIAFLFLVFWALILNSARPQSINDLLDGYYAYNRFWGNVLVVQNGKIIFQKSYGLADKDKGIENNAGTSFNLASIAKTFTATAIFKLHDEGRLSIYDRVDKYIPGFVNDKTDSLKILNLLNHTSGLGTLHSHNNVTGKEATAFPETKPVTLEQMVGPFRETKLNSRPGSIFEYNNYNYIFLAYIIEKVTGMDYFSYLKATVLTGAKLTNTFSQLHLPESAATGHVGIGTDKIRTIKSITDPSWYTGAAGIYSTTGDLYNFLQSVFLHRQFSEGTLKLMLDTCVPIHRRNMLWTAGWQKHQVDGKDFYSHGGSIEGFSARIGYLPDENISIVILSNLVKDYINEGISSVNFSFVDNIADDIIRIMHGKKVAFLPLPAGKPDKKLAGKYKLDDSHSANLSFKNDSLFLNTEVTDSFTLFDYYLNREIDDTSRNYRICKIFTNSLISNDFNDFGKFATEEMRGNTFNNKDIKMLTDFWKFIPSRGGKYRSSNIYDRKPKTGYTDYTLAYHFDEAETTMQISFNNEGLINGFFILRLIPRCHVQTVNLIPTGKDEYFVDGYRYGGFNDFRIKYDRHERSLNFNDGETSFAAFKYR